MKTVVNCLLAVGLVISVTAGSQAQPVTARLRLAGWEDWSTSGENGGRLGLVALPEISTNSIAVAGLPLAGLVSAKVMSYRPNFGEAYSSHDEAEWYRYWVRLAGNQAELRLGRQKINFGPAWLLRSLMWFDRLDPRDPLQLTPGVTAALFRYYWLNNVNLWIWVVKTGRGRKGLDFLPGVPGTYEPGGRLQTPLLGGQTAISFHTRKVSSLVSPDSEKNRSREYRFALDARFDVEIGFWAEWSRSIFSGGSWDGAGQQLLTVGADYTLPLGNGVHLLVERLQLSFSRLSYAPEDLAFTALLIDYPLGLLDQLQAMFFRNEHAGQNFYFWGWRHTRDRFSVSVSYLYSSHSGMENELFLGAALPSRGLQIMVIIDL